MNENKQASEEILRFANFRMNGDARLAGRSDEFGFVLLTVSLGTRELGLTTDMQRAAIRPIVHRLLELLDREAAIEEAIGEPVGGPQ